MRRREYDEGGWWGKYDEECGEEGSEEDGAEDGEENMARSVCYMRSSGGLSVSRIYSLNWINVMRENTNNASYK